jgi:vanillate O-demethylase monooxygenase subunit
LKYISNAWYVAGWASEFDDELRRVTILEQHIVMYRSSTGTVVALEDHCPHRLLPLSKGKRIGDDIQCGYHGMTFNCEGKCVRVPGQENIPGSAYVEAYLVHEKHDIVFIWMGETGKANIDEIFDLPQFTNANWHAHQGEALHLKSNYLNVAENLVDPAHVSFVHPTTLGNTASENIPVHVDTESDVLVAWRWIRDAPPIGFFQSFGGFTGNVDRWHYYYLHLPCTAVIDFGSADSQAKLAEDDRDKGVRIFALHFLTPVTQGYTIDRWMHLRNTAVGDADASAQMDAMFKVAFSEDKIILEAIQEQEQLPQKRKPIKLAIDKGPAVYRRRIRELIETESARKTGEQVNPEGR